ncbi:MAG TPA: hypothetical protein VFC19_47100 [Candidatus Limnocylindrales bacterium]|nr:hypothetical protein [Candidatus Limnocylindrales bacterium]
MTDLYELLPRVYRARDELGDGQLRRLLAVVADQLGLLEDNLDRLHDDQFIETCADWVVPYIGDLIGYRPLHSEAARVSSPRAEVANTIAYRRRKGTAAMLEQLAYDVTGWKARAVEFFERLAATQYMNHPRDGKGGTVDVRLARGVEPPGVGFDEQAHLAEVRRISTGTGRYNIHNVGLFLWRANAIELTRVPLTPDGTSKRRFRFHPLGIDMRLFGRARTEEEITHLAEPMDVPLPLTRRFLSRHDKEYIGVDRSLMVGLLGAATPEVKVCALTDMPNGDWAHAPTDGKIAIDPVLGRVYFPTDVTGGVTAIGTYHYGSALDIGGGGYGRKVFGATKADAEASGGEDLGALLNATGVTVEIKDNWRYAAPASISANEGMTVVLRAADMKWPHIEADPKIELKPGDDATIVLDGLLVSGGPVVIPDNGDREIRKVVLRHCTLVPGPAPSLVVEHPFATVELLRCVLGPITAVDGAVISLTDCVIDAGGAGLDGYKEEGLMILNTSTVIGGVRATEVEISNSIVLGKVVARRRQSGCARFSFLPEGSLAPQQYRCVSSPRPDFTSLRYGYPGYVQLRRSASDSVRCGADNDGEMGAGNYLLAPQREANLRLRLDEYLRFGLEAGIFYAT